MTIVKMHSLNLFSLLFGFFALFTLSAAWPWPPYSGSEVYGQVIDKRDTSSSNTAEAITSGVSVTSQTGSATDAVTSTGTNTASEPSKTGTETGSGSTITSTAASRTTNSGSATSTFIDPRLPAGGISMITPAVEAPVTYYKIGNHVTFAWNYTSLVVTPSAIDVVASCSLNSATYTISSNMSVAETGSVIWDTHGYQATATVPLLTASYTLIVVEAGKAVTDIAGAGHLGTTQYDFSMYLPQSYTPLNEGFVCATCSAAMSDMERQALGFMLTMATITVLSFTWFTGGLGLFA